MLLHVVRELLADTLSPPSCAACDARVRSSRHVLCAGCAVTVERCGRSAVDEARAFGWFGGALATAIRRFKYAGRPDLAKPLGHLLREAMRATPAIRADVVVPVPLHPRRVVERGYNQAALLARAAAEEIGAALSTGALERRIDTAHQASLGHHARHRNLVGAFAASAGDRLRGSAVLLVDDVATTGVTLDECRKVLLDAGASKVTAVVVARTPAGTF